MKDEGGEGVGEGVGKGSEGVMMRKISMGCFMALVVLVLGSWCAYFWGVATGNNV